MDPQCSVMKIRMVPVDQLFRRFPRMVRDVARQCGGKWNSTSAGRTPISTRGFSTPLRAPTHLVRNAVSHGIEPAEELCWARRRKESFA